MIAIAPDEHEDAVFEFAHDPGEHDLREEGDCGTADADRENGKRHALCNGLFRAPGEDRCQAVDNGRKLPAEERRQPFASGFVDHHGVMKPARLAFHAVIAWLILRNGSTPA
jgi:hypothetical protein